MELFLGGYQDFLDRGGWILEEVDGTEGILSEDSLKNKKELRKKKVEERVQRDQTLKPLKKKVDVLEQSIHDLEQSKVKLNQQMLTASESSDAMLIQSVSQDLKQLEKKLENVYEYFWKISQEYENCQNKLS
jgi:DNA repair exonuclease SbcCD ATPase subunit